MPPPLRALIWDVDGTLAETEDEGHRVAFNLAFEEAGLPWRWDSALYGELLQVAGGKERLQAWWSRLEPARAQAPDAQAAIRSLHARKTVHYLRLLHGGHIGLRPGVARLVADARRRGLRQAIATTTTPDNVHALLQAHFGGDAAVAGFEVVGAGDVVGAKKPAPDIYRWVLERMGLAPHECLALEDSPAGVQAAQAAGVPVVLVRARYTPPGWSARVLADLDAAAGFGGDAHEARGWVHPATSMEQPWQGQVDAAVLYAWWQQAWQPGGLEMASPAAAC